MLHPFRILSFVFLCPNREELACLLNISDTQLSYITSVFFVVSFPKIKYTIDVWDRQKTQTFRRECKEMSDTAKKKIAIGVEDFKRIIDKNGYFVDKTLMIQKLIESEAMVTLFTRPRRFGKTLNQFMIRR